MLCYVYIYIHIMCACSNHNETIVYTYIYIYIIYYHRWNVPPGGWLTGREYLSESQSRGMIYTYNRVSSRRRGAAAVNYPRDNDDDHWLRLGGGSEVRDFIARLMSISGCIL